MSLKLTEICNRVATVEIMCRMGHYEGRPFTSIDVEAVTTDGAYILDGYNWRSFSVKHIDEAIRQFVDKNFVCDDYIITNKVSKMYFSDCARVKYSFDLHTVEKL